ncbi:hypothetical protein F4778DRAFT_777892 [Xylariomycetidae sp. FL2044]|nr:hypothetical protein F4778DRAFT_777892 [Xylariomycetidae sp. FL2044]
MAFIHPDQRRPVPFGDAASFHSNGSSAYSIWSSTDSDAFVYMEDPGSCYGIRGGDRHDNFSQRVAAHFLAGPFAQWHWRAPKKRSHRHHGHDHGHNQGHNHARHHGHSHSSSASSVYSDSSDDSAFSGSHHGYHHSRPPSASPQFREPPMMHHAEFRPEFNGPPPGFHGPPPPPPPPFARGVPGGPAGGIPGGPAGGVPGGPAGAPAGFENGFVQLG